MKKKVNICKGFVKRRDMSEESKEGRNDEVYSNVVRAGKRTYFFDVKSTRNNDLYLTLTESKKSFQDGKPVFQKHKLFLYKEDFEKFSDGLRDALDKIEELKKTGEYSTDDNLSDYSSVDFNDL
jgi:hypothetical protein